MQCNKIIVINAMIYMQCNNYNVITTMQWGEYNSLYSLSIFELNSELFLQTVGTLIGIRPAPSYANLFMANIDKIAVKGSLMTSTFSSCDSHKSCMYF